MNQNESPTYLIVSVRKNTFLVSKTGDVSIGDSETLAEIVFAEGTIDEQKTLAEDWSVNRLNYYAKLEPDIFFDAYLTVRLVDAYQNNQNIIECALVVAGDKTIEWYE